MKNDLVSIIVPVYNAGKFILDTIETVKKQTYQNWELILVDDKSSDDSMKIIKKNVKSDKRIKIIELKNNSGAAYARNIGIDYSNGEYLCFLDADDLWDECKLQKQVEFIKMKNAEFIYSSYEFADENGIPNGKVVVVPKEIDYKGALKNTTIWTCTVMFNMNLLSKDDIKMPNVYSEDTACWWKVLKKIKCAFGMQDVLAYYRRSAGTLSSNKFIAIKRIWNLYRNVEKLSFLNSCICFFYYAINAIKRRI